MKHSNNKADYTESTLGELKSKALWEAYSKLPDAERISMNKRADHLALFFPNLGRKGAIEVLGKLGMEVER